MHETSKAVLRRLHDSRYITRYFVGDGIDIGAGRMRSHSTRSSFP